MFSKVRLEEIRTMLTYNLTHTGSDSLYEYLCKSIKNDIMHGMLKPGDKLPSKRVFAANLGVSVITVENAYAQLIDQGYIYSIPKRGYYVADFGNMLAEKKQTFVKEMVPLTGGNTSYFADFSSNQTSSDLFPFTIWSKVVREILSDSRVQLMTNSPCGGISALRSSIAMYLKNFRGMTVQPEQIIIGAGTEYLYGLLIQLLGRERTYAVENPGYSRLEKIYRSFRVPCAWIPLDEGGVCVSDLEDAGVDIVHVTPSHQYPTGIVMPISRRYELLGWAAREEGRYIIEDDYDSELRLSGQPIPTLQSIDLSEKVIYLNTFTKTLCSTVRISYMILPPGLLSRFYEGLSFYSCTVSNFEQYTLARFIEEGKFEMHINRLRSHYRRKRDLLLEALQKSKLGDMVSISGEKAGLHFLMTVHTDLPESVVIERAKSRGIKLAALSGYFHGERPPENVYVMHYSSIDVDRADEIMARLYKSCT
ncbi:MAG: PLP-dependent aminotransferase family protein [Clostridiales bacterium]|nr:PLP-dependent aminotransferase family protein [Clostridiales bacterium]